MLHVPLTVLLTVLLSMLSPGPAQAAKAPGKLIRIDRDNLVIRESCTLVAAAEPVLDLDENGVVQIVGDGLTVHFQWNEENSAGLRGSPLERAPEDYQGIGILIRGQGVKLSGARVRGYRVGIQALAANRLELLGCDVSDNRRQRLRSTPESEALEDWLAPHANDEGQWAANYGAGIYLKGGEFLTVKGCRARDVQNGLLLERTRGALVSDNDFSFLSGWGIALWRASDNFITRNALDFCIRGYSHGVYNRGQDSAGILLFEQCSNNFIAENSATHGGDGLFGFAGQEALGNSGPSDLPRERLGNNDNIIARNDFSYAAAHGLELTFSFGNRIFGNRLVGNAICGIWGGYSRETVIAENLFAHNGDAGYGGERGAINIEHGQRNYVLRNEFQSNQVGVRLWWDEDAGLAELPWTRANGFGSGDNILAENHFRAGPLGIELIQAGPTTLAGNSFEAIEQNLLADEGSQPQQIKSIGISWDEPDFPIFGESRPVGAHPEWDGREQILMGAYGPCDLSRPQLWRLPGGGAQHAYRLLGPGSFLDARVSSEVKLVRQGQTLLVRGKQGGVQPYKLSVSHTPEAGLETQVLSASGVLVQADWKLCFFAWQSDPREDVEAWRAQAGSAPELSAASLDFAFNYEGPAQLPLAERAAPGSPIKQLPKDRFGTLASCSMQFPAGRWRLKALADDGLRVWVDGQLLIDAWKHQATSAYHADFEVEEPRAVELRVEHFELDGAARLSVDIVRAPGAH